MSERTPIENALIACVVAKSGVMSANWADAHNKFRETLDALNALHDYVSSHRRLGALAETAHEYRESYVRAALISVLRDLPEDSTARYSAQILADLAEAK